MVAWSVAAGGPWRHGWAGQCDLGAAHRRNDHRVEDLISWVATITDHQVAAQPVPGGFLIGPTERVLEGVEVLVGEHLPVVALHQQVVVWSRHLPWIRPVEATVPIRSADRLLPDLITLPLRHRTH